MSMMDSTLLPAKDLPAKASDTYTAKTRNPLQTLIILGILGGAFIALGSIFYLVATQDGAGFVGVGLTKLVGGIVFSTGLILIVIAGGELFTGSTLMSVPLMDRRISLMTMLRQWGIVYSTNFLGAILVAGIVYYSGIAQAGNHVLADHAIKIASTKAHLPFWEAFFRAIMCNWFVCLAVWLALSAQDLPGKVLGIVFPIAAFVAAGFEHVVANMFLIPYGIFLNGGADVNWAGFIHNAIPVTLGNIVGGAIFVGMAYWLAFAQKKNTKN